jgi:hypothetical protein
LTQASSNAGSADKDMADVTTNPEALSPVPTVITLQLPTKARIASRNSLPVGSDMTAPAT